MLAVDKPSRASSDPLRVLLVEDNKGDADLVQEYLLDTDILGVELFEARALSETLRMLTSEQLDAVLLDLQLPDSRGLDTMASVQACAPDLAIIVLTGEKDPELAEMAIARGAQDYIHKRHLGPELLSRALKFAVGRSRIRRGLCSVLDASPVGAIVTGSDQRVRYANPAARELLCLLGSTGVKLPPQLVGMLTSQFQLESPGQDPRWLDVTSRGIEWYGERAQLFIVTEVTQQRRVRDLEELLAHANRLATAGQLAASVAHEVNNPATYVIGNLAELKESLCELKDKVARGAEPAAADALGGPSTPVFPDLDTMLELCEESAGGMTRIVQVVRELRDFSRSGPGALEPLDVNLILRGACRMTERLVRSRALLTLELDEVPAVIGRRAKLEQVFTNLLINAAQAIEDGARASNWIKVTSKLGHDEVVVRVEDTGCGMTPDVKRSVLEPFFTTKPRGVGTGLGLSVSHQIVREHGGRLNIETRAGHGTVFEIAFPLSGPRQVCGNERGVALARRMPLHQRLLVIETDASQRAEVLRLASKNHEVYGVSGWEEARRLLAGGREVDAILCDVTTPLYDAAGVYQALCSEKPEVAARLVFCRGESCPPGIERFIASVPNPSLMKPFSESELEDCLRRIRQRRPTS